MRYKLWHTHPSEIDPVEVTDESLADRLAAAAKKLQEHVCNDTCLQRRYSVAKCKQMGYDLTTLDISKIPEKKRADLLICRKGFPKAVPNTLEAKVVKQYDGIINYFPVRDHCRVNNYNPVLLHAWSANMDEQVLHSHGKAYRLSYSHSKVLMPSAHTLRAT